METTSWPGGAGEMTGTCSFCGKTFIDVFGYPGDVLPDYVPVRLIEHGEEEEITLGEWCSRGCFISDLGRYVATRLEASTR